VHKIFLVGEPEGKTPFGRPRRTWEDNTGMDQGNIMGGSWSRELGLAAVIVFHSGNELSVRNMRNVSILSKSHDS
jgi:hypothetical protein